MGIGVERTKDRLKLSAKKHAEEFVRHFNLIGGNPAQLPHRPDADFSKPKPNETVLDKTGTRF